MLFRSGADPLDGLRGEGDAGAAAEDHRDGGLRNAGKTGDVGGGRTFTGHKTSYKMSVE